MSPPTAGASPEPVLLRRVLLAVLLGLFALQALSPLVAGGTIEVDLLRDDAFHMFDVAQRLVAGEGFSYDGVHAAGGVQVLWTLVLALPALVLQKAALPVTACVLGLLLLLAACALAYRLARRYCDADAALVLAAFLGTRPLMIAEAMNGQESALGLCVLLIVARRALDALEGKGVTDGALDLGLFVWMIALPWARTELLALPLALAAVYHVARLLVLIPRAKTHQVEVAAVVSLALYVAGQRVFFGSWLPSSGGAIPWLFHTQFEAGEPSFGAWMSRLWWYARPIALGGPWQALGFACAAVLSAFALAPLAWRSRFAPLVLTLAAALLGAQGLGAVCAGALVLAMAPRIFHTLWRVHEGCAVLGAMLGFVAIAVLHNVVRWYPRDYYWIPLALPALLALSVLAGRWLGELGLHALLPRARRLRAFYLLALASSLLGLRLPVDRMPWQEEMRFAAQQASRLVGSERGLAAFNAGLLGWEHDGPVRCLDGVVDGAALPALRERRLAAWMREQGVYFVVDTPRQLADDDPDPIAPHASGRFLGPEGAETLEALVAFDLPAIGGRHPGTDCHVLAGLRDAPRLPLPEKASILAREEGGLVLLLPQGRYVLYSGGVERPMRFAESAPDVPFVITRLPAIQSELRLDGVAVLSW